MVIGCLTASGSFWRSGSRQERTADGVRPGLAGRAICLWPLSLPPGSTVGGRDWPRLLAQCGMGASRYGIYANQH